MTSAVAIVSGGMDSVTLAYALRHRMGFDRVDLVSVNYGQRHVRELDCAAHAAHAVGGHHIVVDLPVTRWLTGSALTDPDVPVPEGHYADESMRATVVPNRNAMLLSIAVAVAVARNADAVATGVHAGDHPIYPDCRPEFIDAFHRMSLLANEGFVVPGFRVFAPFVHMTKTAICALGDELGVPFADTWSCYQGGEYHCGACGTCVERREAFELAHVPDPTIYSAALPKPVR
jgi:7-cyano-7-deazaguanine synthase